MLSLLPEFIFVFQLNLNVYSFMFNESFSFMVEA